MQIKMHGSGSILSQNIPKNLHVSELPPLEIVQIDIQIVSGVVSKGGPLGLGLCLSKKTQWLGLTDSSLASI